jgi:hypothetical protein
LFKWRCTDQEGSIQPDAGFVNGFDPFLVRQGDGGQSFSGGRSMSSPPFLLEPWLELVKRACDYLPQSRDDRLRRLGGSDDGGGEAG